MKSVLLLMVIGEVFFPVLISTTSQEDVGTEGIKMEPNVKSRG